MVSNSSTIAVIDCGTNTFNLVVATIHQANSFSYLYNDKIPVKLGEGGIDKGFISTTAYERGMKAMIEHAKTIQQFKPEKVIAIGTAALRDASNGLAFIQECESITGIQIELIDGNREAEFIWTAANHCCSLNGTFLVMDIGGGSNEFIIANQTEIFWKKSYRLGVSRLKETFPQENNVTEWFLRLQTHIKTELQELIEQCQRFKVKQMIGTAGSFDTYANVLSLVNTGKEFNIHQQTFVFDVPQLSKWCLNTATAPANSLESIQGIPPFRMEFMPYSCLLTHLVIDECDIKQVNLSTWSLKEGIILDTFA